MREKITEVISSSRNEACNACGEPIEADNPETTTSQILTLITERIKKIENPHTKHRAYPGNISESLSHDGFEECRQAILKEIEK